jgi:hypothetical protein
LISQASGSVLIDGVTFDFDTPTGPDIPTRSYAIRTGAAWDQLYVQNTVFEIDPGARGSIFTEASTSPSPAAYVNNVDFNGGVFGLTAFDSRAEVTGSRINGTTGYGLFYRRATGKVEGSSFDGCGSVRCVSMDNNSSVDVLSNVFEAPVLTGDSGPDLNQLVSVSLSSTSLIDNNDFKGCGYWECIWALGVAEISNNTFTHVTGQIEWDFASPVTVDQATDVNAHDNTFNSCSVACYKILDGSTVNIHDETINVPNGHGTRFILLASKNDDWTGATNTILFEDNVITGSGVTDTSDPLTYPSEVGIEAYFGDITANRNSFTQVGYGMTVFETGSLTGRDNTFDQSWVAVNVQANGTVDLQFNDFTNQLNDIFFVTGGAVPVLTCNYWGNAAGPQGVDPSVPSSVYQPWATAAIAGTGATGCSGS